ncbi:S9 family peptidase [Amycolatopsis sp. AA4]|uniref:S9 family peptidase n=1 Tax=Actinomycetes TaxID=1760 RepID=UPI0001B53A24|nr:MULTISPECIES: prolyl oligopeptidase family serine peptidase [Actinomycetes]ATY16291.1 S9 family peptidase [Amycolatopsis sp. AA4]EFL06531.1 peptidase [Streptomyces sp. AA4]
MTDFALDDVPFLRQQARTQRFTLGAPKQFRVAPDGSRVLFLRSATGTDPRHSLWSFDLATGEETKLIDAAELVSGDEDLPPEERARRERARETGGGVVAFGVDDAFTVVTFTLSGKLYTLDLASGETRVLVDGSVIDPRPNPTGTHVAYVRERRLHMIELATGEDRVLVGEDDEHVTWGLAEFIAGEEMDRTRGYWWAPDGRSVLVERADRGPVPRWTIGDPANPQQPANVVAYPSAGSPNAEVSLAVLGLDGSRVDVEKGDWEYLVTVHWSAGGQPLLAVQPRDQKRLTVLALDPSDGSVAEVHTETDEHWVEIYQGVPAWTADGKLVVESAADGDHRLLVDGKAVTPPGMQLRMVLHVGDEILFTASEDDPTQIHLYRTEGGAVRRLSTTDGVHVGAGSAALAVLSSWSLDHSGPKVTVLRDGVEAGSIESSTVDPEVVPNLTWLTLGERRLRAALVLPRGYEPAESKLPVLLDPYGGPHAQRVLQSRNAFLTPQWLADQGFAVLVVDGRGSPGRGPAWEKEIAGKLADVTLADQVDALHAAAEAYPELDLERVAIRGWSYGGYLSALAVLRRPDVFHAAVAGAPVTDWSLYDTHYTERYLGKPDEEPESYEHNSLIASAGSLERALLIVHGLADDNVFPAHALRLSSALLAKGRAHGFLPLAGATHMTPQAEEVAENLMRTQVEWIHRELSCI